MNLIRVRGEWVVDGTNARMKLLLQRKTEAPSWRRNSYHFPEYLRQLAKSLFAHQ